MTFFRYVSVATLIAISGIASAIPYASNIRVSTLTTGLGGGLTINYLLNEPADTVTIDIMSGITPVATFAGTTTRGANSVVWNGTADNAAGAQTGAGSYRVRVTANKTAVAWSEVTSQRSTPPGFGPAGAVYNTVFNGYSPNSMYTPSNTDSDNFGLVLTFDAYQTVKHAAAIVFNADASVKLGTGLSTRAMIATAIEASATVGNPALWGCAVDPDNADAVYVTGQHGVAHGLYYGNLASSATLVAADPDNILAANLPRGVAVTKEGSSKYAYFAYANSTMAKITMDTLNNKLAATSETITNFATATRYAKNVSVDAAGNLYMLTKTTGLPAAGNNGALYRWDASQIAGLPLAAKLTEANAVWTITPSNTNENYMMGPAITPSGDVYVAFQGGTEEGLYFVGNTGTGTLVKSLALADRVVNTALTGTPPTDWNPSNLYYNIHSDPAGNIWLMDRTTEQLRVYSPGGATSRQITAPTSQTFTITAGVKDWSIY